MLVIIGANGRTGVEVLKQALAAGVDVRPVCRDDRDTRVLDGVVDVQKISYADPDHPASLPPVMDGAKQVIICIDPRVAGPGAPMYGDRAGANCIAAATQAGAEVALYVSVAGGYRWSPSKLNRRAFHLDRWVRRSEGLWSMLRISCFHDEVIEAHVRPPDGGRPHRISNSSRYSPISRRDAARVIIQNLPNMVAGRTIYIGGPEMFHSDELQALIDPYVVHGSGPLTRFLPLPLGDVAVLPGSTRVSAGFIPGDRLADALPPDGRKAPASPASPTPAASTAPQAPSPSPAEEPPPPGLAGRTDPGPHPADMGQDYKVLADWSPELRRVVHTQLIDDLARLGVPTDGATLSFRYARARGDRAAEAHGGTVRPLTGIQVLDADGAVIHKGAFDLLHDHLARELRLWWERPEGGIPTELWDQLDMGVQRRAASQPGFSAPTAPPAAGKPS